MPDRPGSVRPDVLDAVRSCRLWHTATPRAVEELARTARVRNAEKGARLITEGESADEFGVLVKGSAQVFHLGADGKRILYETLKPADPIAAVAALAGGRYPANAEATTDVTVAWLSRAALWKLIEEEPGVAHWVISDLASRVVAFTGVVQSLSLDVPARLARYLFQRALAVGSHSSDGLEVDLGMSKGDLAAALGTVPETLSRAFARLRDDGLIAVQGRRVTILDVRALAEIGSGYADA